MVNTKLFLKNITLTNFATFKNETINFNPQFNTIIGETGSGKSLILDALQIILGHKANKNIIRKDADYALIEAAFITEGEEIKTFFDDLGFPYNNDEIIIKRIIYQNGSSKSFINFQACTSNDLKTFSRKFIDLVGQFENQKLLAESYQLQLLDAFAELGEEKEHYKNLYNEYIELKKSIAELSENQEVSEQKLDYMKFQINEIESLNPSIEDEENLMNLKNDLLFDKNKIETYNQILNLLCDNDDSGNLVQIANTIVKIISKNEKYFDEDFCKEFSDIQSHLEDISFKMNKEKDKLESSQVLDINEVTGRLDLYQKLKRKYGGSVESLMETYEKVKNEYDVLVNLESHLNTLNSQLTEVYESAYAEAMAIHHRRSEAIIILNKKLTEKARELNMEGATFDIVLSELPELTSDGINEVVFTAETNPGEGFHKIKDIASGGELSRILLSLRQILSSKESISIFLFDEIDTGIGGETANCIGRALKGVSENSQVIAITHLPQIAQFADKMLIVSKKTSMENDLNRTQSVVKEIEGNTSAKSRELQLMMPLN